MGQDLGIGSGYRRGDICLVKSIFVITYRSSNNRGVVGLQFICYTISLSSLIRYMYVHRGVGIELESEFWCAGTRS